MCSCSLAAQDIDSVIWFGSEDGLIPDAYFTLKDFQINLKFELQSDNGDVGVLIRTPSGIGSIFDDSYYISINADEDTVIFSEQHNGDGWTKPDKYNNTNIKSGLLYELKILAVGSVYDVYLNKQLVLEDISVTELEAPSIGIATSGALATFYSIEYKEAIDLTSTIGSFQSDPNDSGSMDAAKLFCGAHEDKPLWAGLLSLDLSLLNQLAAIKQDDTVEKVTNYIKCSEMVYSLINSITVFIRPIEQVVDIANMILKVLQEIPLIADEVRAASDKISKVIISILNKITPGFTGIDWNDHHNYDGTIFNPGKVREVFGEMLSEEVCSLIFGGNLKSILEKFRDSEAITQIKTSFDSKILDLLNGNSLFSFVFNNDVSTELKTNDLYREFSFVITIGTETCFAAGMNGCITRMHGISMNLKGESKVFEARSIYMEIPTWDDGISASSFVHFDFLSNYLDVINQELALTLGVSIEIPSLDIVNKVAEQWQAHSDKLSNIPFIGADIGSAVDFVNDFSGTIIEDIITGGVNAKLGVILGINQDRYQDLMNCNGFRIDLTVGDYSVSNASNWGMRASLLWGYEYRKEDGYGIVPGYTWIGDIQLPNVERTAKLFWDIAMSSFDIIKRALYAVDDHIINVAKKIVDSTDDKVEDAVNGLLKGIEEAVNFFINRVNDIIDGANTAIDALKKAFQVLPNALDTAENKCKSIDNQCLKFSWIPTKPKICVSKVVKIDPVCKAVFKVFSSPVKLLDKAADKIKNIPTIDKINIRSVSFSSAKQPDILNVDEYRIDDQYADDVIYDWPSDLTITIPSIIYTAFMLYTIVIASLFGVCGYCFIKIKQRNNPYIPLKIMDSASEVLDEEIPLKL